MMPTGEPVPTPGQRPGPGGRAGHLLRVEVPAGLLERLMLVPILVLGAERAYAYLVYAYHRLSAPTDPIAFESQTALLAWRAQAGLRMYPAWWDYPHVANFFSPCYFGLVGLLGAVAGADLAQLFLIGRAVNIVCGLLTTSVVGVYLVRRYGPWAGVAGAVLSLGVGPMHVASVVVRPDMMAELLGVAGFLLVGDRSPRRHRAGCALLVLAVLTKQTAVIFLLAGAVALLLAGQRRRAGEVLGGGLAALALIVGVMTLTLEPNFATSLLGEGRTPWVAAGRIETLRLLTTYDPDLLVFPALGLLAWNLGPAREVKMTTLAVVVFASGFVATAKYGSGVNYYLSLRVVEACAVGWLWHAARVRRAWQLVPLAAVACVGAWALEPGVAHTKAEAGSARTSADLARGGPDRSRLPAYCAIDRLARDPDVKLLTDVGLFDLYRRERAAFGSPWLFRMLVQSGQVRPVAMERFIENEDYDWIITFFGLDSPDYESNGFCLPPPLVVRARAHYVPVGRLGGFYVYGRRRDPPGRLRSLVGAGLVE
jgi:hypothetical protein